VAVVGFAGLVGHNNAEGFLVLVFKYCPTVLAQASEIVAKGLDPVCGTTDTEDSNAAWLVDSGVGVSSAVGHCDVKGFPPPSGAFG